MVDLFLELKTTDHGSMEQDGALRGDSAAVLEASKNEECSGISRALRTSDVEDTKTI